MTLLVGYAAPEFAILATDQMITWSKTVRVKGKEQVRRKYSESTTKATFFRGQWLIGYAGVADLGGDTELWLLDHLRPLVPHADWRERLVVEMSDELGRLARPASGSWLALMVVGWAVNEGTGLLTRTIETISNDSDPLRLHAGRAAPNFRQFHRSGPGIDLPTGQDFRLWAVGNVPPLEEMKWAADAIARYRSRHQEKSREIARTLARVIARRSAALKGAGVGTSVQVTVMPRAALGQQYLSSGVFTEPLESVASIHFNPRRQAADGHPVIETANLVTELTSMMGISISFGTSEMIGPRQPFIEPDDDDPDDV
jgi:hypothetical protein